jgi:signal transduction histidine kinase
MARILVVDDDVDHLGIMSSWLENEKHSVDALSEATQAREHLQRDEYDLLILDWDMPDINGIDLLKQFRAAGGTTPVLMLTGRADINDKAEGLDSGANDYLTKPFHMKELSARVRALLRTQEQMSQNPKLAMLSHDLKSPLSSITLNVELILNTHSDSLPEQVKRILGRTQSDVNRLSRMASTLLDAEKLEAGKLNLSTSETRCSELIECALAAVWSLANQKGIELKIEQDGEIIVLCDKDRTIQVLVNLLANAIKFSPKKSAIAIRFLVTPARLIRFEVIDEGPGVPPNQVGSLFSKFQQLDQPSEIQKQGSGLGLYICKKLINAQGGKIGYLPAETGGSCFWFEFADKNFTHESQTHT